MGQRAWFCGVLALGALLTGCGGGGEPAAKPAAQDGLSSVQGAGVQGQTLSAFSASSALPAPQAAASSASAASVDAAIVAASTWFGQELSGNSSGGNVAVVMPMARSFLSALPRAAQGATLAEIQSVLGTSQAQAVASAPGLPVRRQLWAQSSHVFLKTFLSDTQWSAPAQPVSAWQAAELDFSRRADSGDAAFQQALFDTGLTGQWLAHADLNQARLVQLDRLDLSLPIAGSEAVPAVFTLEGGSTLETKAIRLSSGVRLVAGSDHEVRLVRLGDYTVLQITPAQGGLADFSTQRLPGVIHGALAARDAGTAATSEMWLPVGRHVMASNPHRLAQGINLAYDKVNADLRGLDPQGGTHLLSLMGAPAFEVSASEIRFSAASLLAYVYSFDNLNQSGGGSHGVIITSPVWFTPSCPLHAPGLRSSFLVILDAQERVVTLAGLRTVAGDSCVSSPASSGPFTVPIIGTAGD